MKNSWKITIVVAEDEPPIRKLLQSYLEDFPQVEVAAAASSGKELLEITERIEFDAVFLDIQMPDMDGLSAAAKIKGLHPDVFIVFVTAHTKYAAESYQLEAVDYLVKPVTRDGIARAIKKIEKFLSLNNSSGSSGQDRILIKNNHEIYFVNPAEIFFVEKELKKTVIHSVNGKYFTTEPLYELEKKLGQNFFRCHRGFIINTDRIERIVPIADRLYEVSFYNYPHRVTMRRQKLEELCSIMAGKA